MNLRKYIFRGCNALCPYVKSWRIIHQNTFYWSSSSSSSLFLSHLHTQSICLLPNFLFYCMSSTMLKWSIGWCSILQFMRVIIFWCVKIIKIILLFSFIFHHTRCRNISISLLPILLTLSVSPSPSHTLTLLLSRFRFVMKISFLGMYFVKLWTIHLLKLLFIPYFLTI